MQIGTHPILNEKVCDNTILTTKTTNEGSKPRKEVKGGFFLWKKKSKEEEMKPFTSQEQELTTGLGLAVVVVVVSAFYALFSKGKGNGGGKRTGGTTTRTTTKERRSFFYRKSIDETFGLLQLLYDRKCFGGRQKRYSHESKVCNNRMVRKRNQKE